MEQKEGETPRVKLWKINHYSHVLQEGFAVYCYGDCLY